MPDELLDVDPAIAERAPFAVGLGDLRLDGDDALQTWLEVVHGRKCIAQLESAAVAHEVTLIPGDGTGPELAEATRRVLEATGVGFEWDVQEAGADVMDHHGGNPLPEATLDSIRRTGVALKGPITTPVGGGFRSVNVGLRKALDLYAQVRPCKTYEGVRTRFDDVDLIIVRENTEDLYAGIEYEEGTRARRRADRLDRAARRQAAPPRRGHLDQADLDLRNAPDRPVRLRLRAPQRPPQGHGRPQGEHHEVHGRALPARRA